MIRLRSAALLAIIQIVLVLSIAGKYLYERKTCPRIWVRATDADPNQPLRGRYLALHLLVDVCALPHDATHYTKGYPLIGGGIGPGFWNWPVTLEVAGSHLVPRLAEHPSSPHGVQQIMLQADKPCERVSIGDVQDLFIPDRAKAPAPRKSGEELWVEVTIPPHGPPRPIQIALADPKGFHVFHFE